LIQVVNIINILQAALSQYSFAKVLQSQTVIREKFGKTHLCTKKAVCKILMKLISG